MNSGIACHLIYYPACFGIRGQTGPYTPQYNAGDLNLQLLFFSMKQIIPNKYEFHCGESRLSIPNIGLGVYLVPLRDTAKVVEEALNVGYRLVDTARCYGNELQTAQGIANFLKNHPEVNRKDIFYTTKIWSSDFGEEPAKRAIDESIQDAEPIGYIDMYLVHTPESTPEARLATYKKLQEAVDHGKIKYIGVSNYGVKHLKELFDWKDLKYPPVVNQIEINPWFHHKEIVDYCREKNVLVQVYSPLMMGHDRLRNSEELNSLASKYKKTPAQIILRWNLQLGYIPVVKSVKKERLEENFNVFDFEIEDADMKQMCSHDEKFMCSFPYDPTEYEH